MKKRVFAVLMVALLVMQCLTMAAFAEAVSVTGSNGKTYSVGAVYDGDQNEVDALPDAPEGYKWTIKEKTPYVAGYVDYDTLLCTVGEHTHSTEEGACMGYEFSCTTGEHTHSVYGGECYTQSECGITEHTHTAYTGACYSQTCTKREHTHGPSCVWGLVCRYNEHKHGAGCYELSCTTDVHTHSTEEGACMGYAFSCTTDEHTHSAYGGDCYTQKSCDITEHTHSDECYQYVDAVLATYDFALVEDKSNTGLNGSQSTTFTIKVTCGDGAPAMNVPVTLGLLDFSPIFESYPRLEMSAVTNANGVAVFSFSIDYNQIEYLKIDGVQKASKLTFVPLFGQTLSYRIDHKAADAVISNEVAPSCVEAGSYQETVKCAFCFAQMSSQTVPVDATGHTVAADEAVAATCTETGLTAGTHCSVCGEVLTAQEVIPAAGHTVAADEAVAATCTETGLTAGTHCSVCGEVLTAQEVIPAASHTIAADEAVAATCTETGLTAGSHCSVCNEILVAQREIPANGHTEVSIPAVAATCTAGGLSEGTRCSTCGTILIGQRSTSMLGHLWDNGTVNKEATETEEGRMVYTCLRNGVHTYVEVIPVLEAAATEPAETEPTVPVTEPTEPAAAATEPAAEEIGQNDVPLATAPVEVIEDSETPLAGAEATWSVLSMILSLVTVAMCVAVLAGTMTRRGSSKTNLILSAVVSVAAVVAFLVISGFSGKMVFADKSTLLELALTAVQGVLLAASMRKPSRRTRR